MAWKRAAHVHYWNSFGCILMYERLAVKCTFLIGITIVVYIGIEIICHQPLMVKLQWRKHLATLSPKRYHFGCITWIQVRSKYQVHLILVEFISNLSKKQNKKIPDYWWWCAIRWQELYLITHKRPASEKRWNHLRSLHF